MPHIHLATALVRRDDAILLVASRYPNHPQPLWNLPGGRQKEGELLRETALRELREETSFEGAVRGLCYVSESYDGQTHFINFTFDVEIARGPSLRQDDKARDHIVDTAWVPIAELESRLIVNVVREPLLQFLSGESTRYAGYPEAGISIEFPD